MAPPAARRREVHRRPNGFNAPAARRGHTARSPQQPWRHHVSEGEAAASELVQRRVPHVTAHLAVGESRQLGLLSSVVDVGEQFMADTKVGLLQSLRGLRQRLIVATPSEYVPRDEADVAETADPYRHVPVVGRISRWIERADPLHDGAAHEMDAGRQDAVVWTRLANVVGSSGSSGVSRPFLNATRSHIRISRSSPGGWRPLSSMQRAKPHAETSA